MGLKSKLKKTEEILELALVYPYFSPHDLKELGHSRGADLVDKYRDTLVGNPYFTKFIEPLVSRLYDDAIKSKRVTTHKCRYKGTTLAYGRGKYFYPILTMGSKEQLQKVCKKECYICPILVYNPFAVLCGIAQLSIFEAAGVVSKVRNKING